MNKYIQVPFSDDEAEWLRAGDFVYISGTIYTARDAAHKRMAETLDRGEGLPFSLKGNIIYYMGPSPARNGRVIGLDMGLKGMIGKGKRSEAVIEGIRKNKAVYFAAIGGAGALLSRSIKDSEVIAYDDLGTEAIRRLRVENFPVIVVVDSQGNNLYDTAEKMYKI